MELSVSDEYLGFVEKQVQHVNIKGLPGLYSQPGKLSFCNKLIESNDDASNLSNSIKSLSLVGGEELIVNLPFAGIPFTIRIFLYFKEPWIPPDFLFGDKKFSKETEVEDLEEMVPCLDNWKFSSEDNLLVLLSQIYSLYKRYQIKYLQLEYEVLYGEYESILNISNISADDIEVFVCNNSQWVASFLIKLPIKFEDIPSALLHGNPGKPKCVLNIIVKKTDESYVPKLYLSPQVEALIGGATTLGIPLFPSGSSITDYVQNVTNLIEEKLRSILLSFELRKQFMALILSQFHVLEYNSESLSSISLLVDVDDFNFILAIDLPHTFPKSAPMLQLRSIYHMHTSVPYMESVNMEMHPSEATVEDVFNIIRNSLAKWATAFKNASVKRCS